MFSSIKRNPEKAKKADGGSFITQTGEYIVMIAQASAKQTQSGAEIVELTIKDRQANAICTSRLVLTKANGDEAFGTGMLHALMTIINVEEIKPVPMKVFRRDRTTEDGFRIPELERQEVGVLLQRVNDVYQGKDKFDMNIVSFFDPKTRRTASEIINNVEKPVKLDQKLKNLKDRETDEFKAFHSAPPQTEVPSGYGQDVPSYGEPF